MKYYILILLALIYSTSAVTIVEGRKRIAVIDTGVSKEMLNKPYMCRDKAQVSLDGSKGDWHGHGTNVVGLIADNMDASQYCITMYAFDKKQKFKDYVKLLGLVYADSPAGLNLSLGGIETDLYEFSALYYMAQNGTAIFAAAGNDGADLNIMCYYFPACYAQFIDINVIGNFTSDTSNKGKIVDVWLDGSDKGLPAMTGTSQATAIATGIYFSR